MEWQPIETAPKDREILAWFGLYSDGDYPGMGIIEWSDLEPPGWFFETEIRVYPTHWMPLPAPPQTKPQGE